MKIMIQPIIALSFYCWLQYKRETKQHTSIANNLKQIDSIGTQSNLDKKRFNPKFHL